MKERDGQSLLEPPTKVSPWSIAQEKNILTRTKSKRFEKGEKSR